MRRRSWGVGVGESESGSRIRGVGVEKKKSWSRSRCRTWVVGLREKEIMDAPLTYLEVTVETYQFGSYGGEQ